MTELSTPKLDRDSSGLIAAPDASEASHDPSPSGYETDSTSGRNRKWSWRVVFGDYGDAVDGFAATYRGRNIEFDGNIADWAPHGDSDTRFDFLIYGGDYSLESPVYAGPAMKFEDVNRLDLNLIGDNIPDGVSAGDNFHIVAEVVESRSAQCLFILDPVSMELR